MAGEIFHIDKAVDIVAGGGGTLRFVLPGSEFTLRDPAGIARRVSSDFRQGAEVDDVLGGFDEGAARTAASQVIDVFRSRRVLRPLPGGGGRSAGCDSMRDWIRHYAVVPDVAPRAVRLTGEGVLAETLRARLAAAGVDAGGRLEDGACHLAVADRPDLPRLRRLNAEACRLGHVFMPAWLERSTVHWGPVMTPGATGCLECLLHRQQAARRRAQTILECDSAGLGVSAIVASVAGGLVAAEVMRWAFDAHVETDVGMAWSFDLLTMGLSGARVLRLPRCPACGGPNREVS